MGDLSKNFSSNKMKCQCGCNICNVKPEFLRRLQQARTSAGIKFVIRSGCRCPSHNAVESGKIDSDHITTDTIQCEGADVQCYDSRSRYIIITSALEAGLTRIGISFKHNFIHLGMSETNPEEVIFGGYDK